MYQLTYASTADEVVTISLVEDIVSKAKKNNEKHNITGFLLFNSGFFLQCLEGDITSVNKIFSKIVADKRHYNTTILSYNQISERAFPYWTMALASEVKAKKEIYLKYGYINEFNPYKLATSGALPFLKEVSTMYF